MQKGHNIGYRKRKIDKWHIGSVAIQFGEGLRRELANQTSGGKENGESPVFNSKLFFSFRSQIINQKKMKNFFALLLCVCLSIPLFAGHYVEFKFTGAKGMSGVMKAWSQGGNSRSQFQMTMPGLPTDISSATLFLESDPAKIFMINEKEKTYVEHDRQKNDEFKDDKAAEYEVVVVGKETVNGYASTHVKVRKKGTKSYMNWWVTKDLKYYSELKSMKAKYLNSKGMYAALAEKGADGFPVRMLMEGDGDDSKMQMDLVKAETMEVPASKFSLSGYTKSETPALSPMGGMDVEKMKNMTPEERQKLMQEMMKKYQK